MTHFKMEDNRKTRMYGSQSATSGPLKLRKTRMYGSNSKPGGTNLTLPFFWGARQNACKTSIYMCSGGLATPLPNPSYPHQIHWSVHLTYTVFGFLTSIPVFIYYYSSFVCTYVFFLLGTLVIFSLTFVIILYQT